MSGMSGEALAPNEPPLASPAPTPLKRPPSSSQDHNSPPKRIRIDSAQASTSLNDIPVPVLLLSAAEQLWNRASELRTQLSSQEGRDEYQSCLAGCVKLLRKLLARGEGGKIELRGRIMLVEVLGLADGKSARSEIERVITKGISLAQTHDAFTTHRFHLIHLQATLPSTTPKFARSLLNRVLPSFNKAYAAGAEAWFSLSLLLASISDFSQAIATYTSTLKAAQERGETDLVLVIKVLMIDCAFREGRQDIATPLVEELATAWWPTTDSTTDLPLPRELKIRFLFMYCLLLTARGKVKEAKEKLKIAHALADTMHNSPEEGPVIVKLRGGGQVRLDAGDVGVTYGYAFLVSVAVHRDPFGSNPKAILFANEGIKKLTSLLDQPSTHLSAIATEGYRTFVARMLISIHLLTADLHLMRSAYPSAQSDLDRAIALARSHSLWDEVHSRITLDHGLLAFARRDVARAEECWQLVRKQDKRGSSSWLLSTISLLLSSFLFKTAAASSLASEILALPEPVANPGVSLLREFANALVKEQITEQKSHLSAALALSNEAGMNHAKCALLALLANLFLWTRNDQAQRMLAASFHIARGLGPVDVQDEKGQVHKVGSASIGLWDGERLYESYARLGEKEKAKVQEAWNAACRQHMASNS